MESGGSQWKVTADDVIYHNKIPGAQVNDVLEFKKVLLLGSREDTTIGRPFVPGASVVAAVEENFKDAQVCAVGRQKRSPGWCEQVAVCAYTPHLAAGGTVLQETP
jgi:large subunit ribosomal protein L21